MYLHVPVIKSGQTKKLRSPWHGPHVVVEEISDVTYRIEEVDNHRKRRMSEIFFQHEKRNFVSPSGHVMFYLLYKPQ